MRISLQCSYTVGATKADCIQHRARLAGQMWLALCVITHDSVLHELIIGKSALRTDAWILLVCTRPENCQNIPSRVPTQTDMCALFLIGNDRQPYDK